MQQHLFLDVTYWVNWCNDWYNGHNDGGPETECRHPPLEWIRNPNPSSCLPCNRHISATTLHSKCMFSASIWQDIWAGNIWAAAFIVISSASRQEECICPYNGDTNRNLLVNHTKSKEKKEIFSVIIKLLRLCHFYNPLSSAAQRKK